MLHRFRRGCSNRAWEMGEGPFWKLLGNPHKALCKESKYGAYSLSHSCPWPPPRWPQENDLIKVRPLWGRGGKTCLSAGGRFLTCQPAALFREGVVARNRNPLQLGKKGIDSKDTGAPSPRTEDSPDAQGKPPEPTVHLSVFLKPHSLSLRISLELPLPVYAASLD